MTLADRLSEARHAGFVGRVAESDQFCKAISAETLPFHVLQVYGPGGIGKTSLLHEFERCCEEEGIPVRYVDGREIEASPDALLAALSRPAPGRPGRLGAGAMPPLLGTAAAADFGPSGDGDRSAQAPEGEFGPSRHVLLIDTYEAIDTLDGWIRETFLPGMPESVVLVLAGRNPPATVWRTDPGWQALVEEMPLRNLAPDESRDLLDLLGVPKAHHESVLAFTHGHPLALTLVAAASQQNQDLSFDPADSPDVIQALVRRLVEEEPTNERRAALEACSIVRAVTEPVLAALLDREDARSAFEWLRSLEFMQTGRFGLFPHDLARDALAADLRWRATEHYDTLHKRARRHYTRRLQQTETPEAQQLALIDYAFLYRDNPVAGPLVKQLRTQSWEGGDGGVGAPTDAEWDTVRGMIEQHEGPEAARIAEHWFGRQPEGFEVFRDGQGDVVGLLVRLDIGSMTDDDETVDPAVAAARRALRSHGSLRDGERALLFRFWMTADAYQDVSPVQSRLFARTVWHYLSTPGLAYSIFLVNATGDWGPILMFVDINPVSEADFDLDGQSFLAYAHDWRAMPPEQWLGTLAARTPSATPTPEKKAPPLLVLSREEFEDAVKEALKTYSRPHKMAGNPLLRSRLVAERAGPGADEPTCIATLQAILAETADALEGDPRDGQYYKALEVTYLKPAASQAIAAERLDLPFSTFRRHLGRGVDFVVDTLWAQEIG